MVSPNLAWFNTTEKLISCALGTGAGQKPAQWLKPGDQVDVNISKIGTLRNGVEYA